jgi:hypothetical protein
MKRVIMLEQLLPASLVQLQQQQQLGSSQAAAGPPTGPLVPVGTGDYVAVRVRELAGRATLISEPLCRTSIAEFVRVFGSTTPQQVPAWLRALQ